ncbi:hypothetical protein Bpfe_027614 [Biomphalaria pfeifferi]|uniref:C-type lectin domain-containing protein n=1 Tax=Biomphalaria pfeifferi TaxID=112525 RepID=A0AAD8EWX3_BIOPF|nr:hypothetical protein Bpfe_027614 [Biomphalaria pfeifferi]
MYRLFVLFCLIHQAWTSTNIWTIPSTAEQVNAQTTILLVRNLMTWYDAAVACRKLGATLTRIETDYFQEKITSFAQNDWAKDWGNAWFGLAWLASTDGQYLAWADNCQSFNASAWNMFETSASSNFKSNNGCYALDKESLLWMRKSCGMKKNFLCSRVEAYNITNINLYSTLANTQMIAVNLSKSSPSDCRNMCDRILGCYVTSYIGNSSCVLGVLSNTSNTYIKPEILIADVYTFNDTQQLDIETAGNTNVTLCTSNNASSSTLTDSAVSLNDLDLLVSKDVCSYNETTSLSQSTSTLTAEYFISDLSSATTTSSDQSSDAEQSTQMLMTSTVHVQNVNFTLEEREALINAIVIKLIIDVKSTLKSQSLLYSAEDRRPSAQALGYVAIGIIVFVLCVIVAIDAPNVYYLLRTQQKKLFNR